MSQLIQFVGTTRRWSITSDVEGYNVAPFDLVFVPGPADVVLASDYDALATQLAALREAAGKVADTADAIAYNIVCNGALTSAETLDAHFLAVRDLRAMLQERQP